MNHKFINAYNTINGIPPIVIGDENVTKSIEEYHNNFDNIIKKSAESLFDTLVKFIKLSNDDDYSENIKIEPVIDSYGKGISIAYISNKKDESLWNFSKTFKDIHTLNFMDFYQRFNNNDYIKESIEKFTNYFKDVCNTFYTNFEEAELDNIDSTVIDIMKNYLFHNKKYEIMVSRQEIIQPINTLKDSLSNTKIFENNEKTLELLIKDKNRLSNSTIIIDKITIYSETFY